MRDEIVWRNAAFLAVSPFIFSIHSSIFSELDIRIGILSRTISNSKEGKHIREKKTMRIKVIPILVLKCKNFCGFITIQFQFNHFYYVLFVVHQFSSFYDLNHTHTLSFSLSLSISCAFFLFQREYILFFDNVRDITCLFFLEFLI